MSAYMPLTIAMRQEMGATDALAAYDEYQARLVEISTEVDELQRIPLDARDDDRDFAYRMLLGERQAIHQHVNLLYREYAVRVALRAGLALERASIWEPCPSTDHDGALIPADRRIEAIRADDHLAAARCAYCAEGLAARLVRDGYHVTIHATHLDRTTDTISEGADR